MSKDYYEVLGVDKNASKDDIKKAYKRLAKKYHPDINKEEGSADKFKEVNEAFSVLSDDQKRQQYDTFGSEGPQGGGFGGFDYSDFMGGGFDFGDIFESFFGGDPFGRRGPRGPQRGANLRFDLEITLEEAAFGETKTILVPKHEACEKCGGTGAKSPGDVKKCDTCHGAGYIKKTKRTPFGMFQTTSACSDCGGSGDIIKEFCPMCDGDGRVRKNKNIEIQIPKGVEDSMRLRVSNEGEAGEKGAPPGDLYVVLHIKPHEIFDRRGDDLYVEQRIKFSQAALGDEIKVPTLTDPVKMKIPAGTQPGTVFRLKGKGIPHLNRFGTGDIHVTVNIEVPTKLTRKQKQLLKDFDESKNSWF
ncbi:MAG: molecular chaperone DnaJ [Candidatus Woesearchaeota archaeon]